MKRKLIEEITGSNPDVDGTAIERCDQAARQLADAGIVLGGYKLGPALGGTILDGPILTSVYEEQNSQQA
ncbi:hypothetical protein [Candidatus Poriferisodalis sp.]|uniref:hypothetical protein n=1 Tax=Candidatus Poriferisodalis sp. TaxID=3101277 RepID=UPI003B5CA8EA